MYKNEKLPELLCPAGDFKALSAALEGGADAVYFGGTDFNARKNAGNFDADSMREAIKLVHAYGAKAYVTQNTLCHDREMTDYLSAAETALTAGADALIVADAGGALEIKKRFVGCELHASTQMSGHNLDAAKKLYELGFSRMVLAREMSREDIAEFTKNSPIEAEVFIHGALCVCHSGQCLFSSMVGGRSGNRGECAQPCRLPYSGGYPLSLKDSCLAPHIPTLIELGVSSLKIEGRMKSPEYVRDVARIYRLLLDERRSATKEEMRELAEIFSRGGFTDGYFTKTVGRGMLGVRSESDKQSSRQLVPFEGLTRKPIINIEAKIKRDTPCSLVVYDKTRRVTYVSETIPFEAINAPLDSETVKKQLSKLGSTPYALGELTVELDDRLMVPVSVLNKLRRDAIEAFCGEAVSVEINDAPLDKPASKPVKLKTASFCLSKQIPVGASEFFDIAFLPLCEYGGEVNGVALPPVIFDSEREEVEAMLINARQKGAEYALVGNIGHVELAKKHGFKLCGDLRLNIFNNSSAALAEKLGFECFVVSPELALPQARDVGGARLVTVYGRLPLMLLEKCVGKELGGCDKCNDQKIILKDRTGTEFPVLREWKHRSVIYNSIHTSMTDRKDLLDKNKLEGLHFIFSDESADECAAVLKAFAEGRPIGARARRLGSAVPSKK